MGLRQSLGLFLTPVTRDLAITATSFTLAIAVQNIVWGASQAPIGALADRFGLRVTMLAGAVDLCRRAAGHGERPRCHFADCLGRADRRGVVVYRVVIGNDGRGANGFGKESQQGVGHRLGRWVARHPDDSDHDAVDPRAKRLADRRLVLCDSGCCDASRRFIAGGADRMPNRVSAKMTMRAVLGQAARHRPFLVMSGAYFVCGLNLVFLTTHLPTYLAICGQNPLLSAEAIAVIGGMNSIGSFTAGWLGGKYPKHILLGLLYILRAFVFTAYFIMPPTPTSTLVFAAAMGMLWLSVAPLVSGLVAEMFGTRYMATLLGIAFVMHQVGSSLGAWGGGLIFDKFGSYDHAWHIGVVIGFSAGVIQILAGGPSRGRDRIATPRLATT